MEKVAEVVEKKDRNKENTVPALNQVHKETQKHPNEEEVYT